MVSETTETEPVGEALECFPVLPIKNTVMFPNLLLPLTVGRPRSIKAIEAANGTEDKSLVVIAQRDASVERPSPDELFKITMLDRVFDIFHDEKEALTSFAG